VRIIAGEYRGRRLGAVPGDGTRPMLDRVKESLFSTLQSRFDGARVLDLFAGTGSLGLEALSRGAAHVRLVESHPKALAVLKANAKQLDVLARIEITRGDALDPALWAVAGEAPDIVFFDSPYPLLEQGGLRPKMFGAMRALVLERMSSGVLVFHSPRRVVLASEFGAGLAVEEREYGTSSLWYVERATAGAAPPRVPEAGT
jgi:16S rRNA (guanine966-N2)-methyltransferase